MSGDVAPQTAGLAVKGLRVSYHVGGRRNPALRGVDLHIAPGTTLGLVGESGCGKTTAAAAILGALPRNGEVEDGSVRLDDTDVLALSGQGQRRWWSRDVALVSQDPAASLNPTMKVGAQVREAIIACGGGRQNVRDRVHGALRDMSLPDPPSLMARYPFELSGGQQQRVMLAMALVTRPRLLVLDEPTTGLDATVQAEVLELIGALRARLGAAVLFVSHDLGLLSRVADRVAVLYAGTVVEEGPANVLLAAPSHPYTAGLVACVPDGVSTKRTAPLQPVPGSLPLLGETDGTSCAFEPRCADAVDDCRIREPALLSTGAHHAVRCVRAGQARPKVTALELLAAPTPVRAGLLEVQEGRKVFGTTVALDGVSLGIGYGEIVGLVGESGSGKTSLGRCVVGLATLDAGSIRLEGEPPRTGRRSTRRAQMVFQHPDASLNPRRTARQILAASLRRLDGPHTVEELAAMVQLDPARLDVVASRLSGGQQQRVAIARAFAGSPALVVCDEPVSALDVSVQAAVLNLLAQLQERTGVSLLLVSHDLAVVRYLADRIAVMYLGAVVQVGPASGVVSGVQHPYTAALLLAATQYTAAAVPGLLVAPATWSAGCRFSDRCPFAIPGVCDREAPPWRAEPDGNEIRCHHSIADLKELQYA